MRVTRRTCTGSPALEAEATNGMTAKEKPLASTNSMKKKLVARTPAASASTSYQPSMTVSVNPTAAWAR